MGTKRKMSQLSHAYDRLYNPLISRQRDDGILSQPFPYRNILMQNPAKRVTTAAEFLRNSFSDPTEPASNPINCISLLIDPIFAMDNPIVDNLLMFQANDQIMPFADVVFDKHMVNTTIINGVTQDQDLLTRKIEYRNALVNGHRELSTGEKPISLQTLLQNMKVFRNTLEDLRRKMGFAVLTKREQVIDAYRQHLYEKVKGGGDSNYFVDMLMLVDGPLDLISLFPLLGVSDTGNPGTHQCTGRVEFLREGISFLDLPTDIETIGKRIKGSFVWLVIEQDMVGKSTHGGFLFPKILLCYTILGKFEFIDNYQYLNPSCYPTPDGKHLPDRIFIKIGIVAMDEYPRNEPLRIQITIDNKFEFRKPTCVKFS